MTESLTVSGDGWTIAEADCLVSPLGLPGLADQSVDHVITDPPYDEHTHKCGRRGHTGYTEANSSSRATFNRNRDLGFEPLSPEQMAEAARQFARIARRWVMAFCAVEMVSDWKTALENAGLDYVRTMAWRKAGSTPQFTGDRPAVAFEAIVLAHRPGRKRWNGRGKHGWYDHAIVLDRGGHRVRCHATQKPFDLMREIVEDFTDPGELVADPYMGSGTTGLACLYLGRRFIGMDDKRVNVETAARRLRSDEAVPVPHQMTIFDLGGAQ